MSAVCNLQSLAIAGTLGGNGASQTLSLAIERRLSDVSNRQSAGALDLSAHSLGQFGLSMQGSTARWGSHQGLGVDEAPGSGQPFRMTAQQIDFAGHDFQHLFYYKKFFHRYTQHDISESFVHSSVIELLHAECLVLNPCEGSPPIML